MTDIARDFWPPLDRLPVNLVDDTSAVMGEAMSRIVLPYFRHLPPGGVQTKAGANDFVTIADTKAEEFLIEKLPQILPGSVVVGEESASQDKNILKRLTGDQWCWIVDPVDGTYEFKNGRDKFRMQVALAFKGVPYFAWIMRPNIEKRDPAGQSVLCAQKGEGVWIDEFRRGQRVMLQPENKPDEKIEGVLDRGGGQGRLPFDASRLPQYLGGARPTMCSGTEIDMMVRGESGGPDWLSFDRCFITPWDQAPQYLVLTEAGGVWHQDGGAPYRASSNQNDRFIAAKSQHIFDRVRESYYPDWVLPAPQS